MKGARLAWASTVALAVAMCLMLVALSGPLETATEEGAAERLYRNGMLPSGLPLVGRREGGARVLGAAGACFNCHRRSGLGTFEGRNVVPPITGTYLFRPGGRHRADTNRLPAQGASPEASLPDRGPYTDATLARAIREGIDAEGRSLDFLMPRYELDEATMTSLVAYLRRLSLGPVPAPTGHTLEFATVMTPDADPVESQRRLDVVQHYLDRKNGFYRGKDPVMLSVP
jgi:hypothetical protein